MREVDVVIPVHGGARFLPRAVASVRAQDADAEVRMFLVDDASPDDAADVMARLAEGRSDVVILRNESNRGVAASRNRAVAAGSAPFVAFLDQDDAWLPGKLARQLDALRERPDAGYVVARQRFRIEEGSRAPSWTRPEWFEHPQPGFLPSTLLVRREIFEAVGPLDETMRAGGDDADWFARARRRGVVCIELDDVLVDRYVHDANLSSDTATDVELLRLVRRHLAEGGAS